MAQDMEAKKRFLALYADNAREIVRLERELELWRERAERQPALEEDVVEDLIKLREELAIRLGGAIGTRREIERAVGSLDDAKLRLLLEYHYVDGKTWQRVAEDMMLDIRWVLRLHRRALASVEIRSRDLADSTA